ncbi:hypothetical protein FHR99_001137 [Litorivivens lipolytica]|uniref:Nucleotide modification associated domain-containing protein n=1 Tax=Litorivivens lipolytica TaxID=1524264 RepID=A0A7W4W3R2_9GAMM|nr:hypothetical protein [Litorivivens lipolytica]
MKIVLSRKGFDSSAGGCPSPILPDGRLLSLPIPDAHSTTTYGAINLPNGLIRDLTRERLGDQNGAHLDPDIDAGAIKRKRGWRPLFGQFGAAQSHLRNHNVGPGDLFLFFGLFRQVAFADGRWQWEATPARHVLWGWFQIDEVWPLTPAETLPVWAQNHPHAGRSDLPGNTLYVARRQLELPGLTDALPGAGCFPRFKPTLKLTAPKARTVSQWRLPRWFYPSQDKPPLSYHRRPERWQLKPRWCELQAAARGQEFVLDSAHYPAAKRWAGNLITKNH